MSVIFLLVIIGVIVAGLFLGGFIWAVKSGQYDDTYTPSVRMLFEDDQVVKKDMTDEDLNQKKTSKNEDSTKTK
jgi:cbb3-type cytochrome oxidase maturation protein